MPFPPRASRARRLPVPSLLIFGTACAVVVGVYLWLGAVCVMEVRGWPAADDYYNLLVEGFQQGHLSVNRAAPPGLQKLPDPYNPAENGRICDRYGLHDMSYYRGRMYLYFGAAPALLVFWPWVLVTGHYLLQRYAVAIFCAVGFLGAAGVLGGAWRRYFPKVNVGVVTAAVLALGLASGGPIIMQRAKFWEVAVSSGYALVMLALLTVWLSLHDAKRRTGWLAAASLLVGLAGGARPFLLLAAPILLLPVWEEWRRPPGDGPRRPPWRLLAAATLPVSACVAGIFAYNFLRFGNPLQFGERYQLAGDQQDKIRHFSLSYLWFNFRVYFLEPVRWSLHSPFAGSIVSPPVPRGHADIEDPYGILTNVPITWLALAVPLIWRGREAAARRHLREVVAAILVVFAVDAVVLNLFYGNCSRYELEFLPELVLLAALGILGVERMLTGRTGWRWAARAGWGLLLAFSITFNAFGALDRFAIQRNNLANAYELSGRVPEAVALYHTALRIKPDYAEAHSNLGSALEEMGRDSEAIAECRRALQLKPDYAKAHDNLANALLAEGKTAEAMTEYRAALRLTPDDATVHYNYGIALERAGRMSEAFAQYEQAVRLNPYDANAHYNLANLQLEAGHTDAAIRNYDAAVADDPAFVDARSNLGSALISAGRLPEAIQQLEAVVQIEPQYAQGHNNLGAAFYRAGRLREAAAEFRAALRIDPRYATARANLERTEKQEASASPKE